MRVKAIYDRSKKLRIIDSETGDDIQGINHVELSFAPSSAPILICKFCDFDIDMDNNSIISVDKE